MSHLEKSLDDIKKMSLSPRPPYLKGRDNFFIEHGGWVLSHNQFWMSELTLRRNL